MRGFATGNTRWQTNGFGRQTQKQGGPASGRGLLSTGGSVKPPSVFDYGLVTLTFTVD
jgi:hypothetical protein